MSGLLSVWLVALIALVNRLLSLSLRLNMKLLLLLLALATLGCVSGSSYSYYRLPTALRPQKYNLRVLTHLENPENLRFDGNVKIHFEVLQNTKNITLHSKNLTIDESHITLRDTASASSSSDNGTKLNNCISSTEVNSIHDFYVMHTCSELLAGHVYELSIPFSAELNRQLEGYYRSSYLDPVANQTR